jgi:hypothetical protein
MENFSVTRGLIAMLAELIARMNEEPFKIKIISTWK